MIRHQVVLNMLTTNGPRVRFSREKDDHTDVPDTIYIRRSDWQDMGRPPVITVTVEPGDRLNAPEEQMRPPMERRTADPATRPGPTGLGTPPPWLE